MEIQFSYVRYLFLMPSTNWESYGTPGALRVPFAAGRPERLHQSSMNFDRTEQDTCARLLFVLACLVVVVYGPVRG